MEHAGENQQGTNLGVGARVAASHGIEEDNVRLGNLVEQVLGVVHCGRGRGVERAEIDELGEDSNVVLEVGFYGGGMNLLELSERIAFGEEGKRGKVSLSWFGTWVLAYWNWG